MSEGIGQSGDVRKGAASKSKVDICAHKLATGPLGELSSQRWSPDRSLFHAALPVQGAAIGVHSVVFVSEAR